MSKLKQDVGEDDNTKRSLLLFILSGGIGASGEQLARTVMAQFPGADISLRVFPKVYTVKQVKQILGEAITDNVIVAHTFVDPKLRQEVAELIREKDVSGIDLLGPLIENLTDRLEQEPLGKPGLYRQLFKSYFDRIDAMDYTLEHDDGKNADGWMDAEIILLGPSRVGKTPISLYLSILGWKVANIPLISGIAPKGELFELHKGRIVGLMITPGELIQHRKHRQKALGVSVTGSDYNNPQKVYAELEEIEKFYRKNKISMIDVTGKPIETSADEIIRLVGRNLKRHKKS